MSWEDNHREDGLWAIVEEAQAVLEEHVRGDELDNADDRVQRLRMILSTLIGYRDHPDVLITPSARRNAGKVVQTITEQLPSIEAIYKVPAGSTVSKFEELARNLRSWPQRGTVKLVGLTQQIQQLENTLTGFKNSASQQIAELVKESESAAEELRADHAKTLEDLRGELSQLSSQVGELRSNSESVGEAVSKAEERIEAAIKAQESELRAELQRRSAEIDGVLEGQSDAFQEFTSKSYDQTETLIASIESKEKEADKILGTLGLRSTSASYAKWAKQQKRAARLWSSVAIILFILAAGVFIESSFRFITSPAVMPSEESLWGEVATRLGMTAVVLAGALYAAKEAGQHRKEELRAKARELVLTTMDPFLVNIDEDARETIRSEAARAIFVLRDDPDGSSRDAKQLPARLGEILHPRTKHEKGRGWDDIGPTHTA